MSETKEIYKAFEEVTRRNVQTAIDFGNETRKMVQEIEIKVLHLEEQIRNNVTELQQIRTMLSQLQGKVFSGGTV